MEVQCKDHLKSYLKARLSTDQLRMDLMETRNTPMHHLGIFPKEIYSTVHQ